MDKERLPQLRILVEISLCVALAFALSFFKLFRLPQGGEVSFTVIPILILALARGAKAGITCGVLFGLVHSLQGGFVIHPVQFLLDYPLAYGSLGLAGLFRKIALTGSIKSVAFLELKIFIGMAFRFFFHFVSGMVFFRIFAPETLNVVKYVLIYNLSYMVPELILSFIIIPPIVCKMNARM